MLRHKKGIKVGVLGQWASGKSTAAKTLIQYLGGEDEVVFILDVDHFAVQAINHILELGESNVTQSVEEDGSRRFTGQRASVWLKPGEDFDNVELSRLHFDVNDEDIPHWLHKARLAAGREICKQPPDNKPVVIEAGFGQYPAMHTLSDLFDALEQVCVDPQQVKWIIVEASYENRAERNAKRKFGPPPDVFEKYSADGGDLTQDQQIRLEVQGTVIKRIANDHNDIERFRRDVIAAFEEMFRDK